MKKKLLKILSATFILVVFLLIVQALDQKINSENYKKIHEFGKQFKELSLEINDCNKDIELILTTLIEENNKITNLDLSTNTLAKQSNACFAYAKKYNNIQIPSIKNSHKKELMEELKEDFSYSTAILGYILNLYIEAKQNNQLIDDFLLLTSLNSYAEKQKRILLNVVDIYLTYSIKDILITRPFLLYAKLKLHQ